MAEFTYIQAKELIEQKKAIVADDNELKWISVDLKFPVRESFSLISKVDECSFRWEIRQSEKDTLKMSLHFMEEDSCIGIFRIDYIRDTVFHSNPVEISDDLPGDLIPYAGKDIYGSHVHYAVKGYKQLAWAKPIRETEIAADSIEGKNQTKVGDAILCFAQYISVETEIILEPPVL